MPDFSKSVRLNEQGIDLHILLHPSDEVIASVWLKLGAAKLLPLVWPAGVPTLRWMLDWAARPENYIFGCFTQQHGSDQIEAVGLTWLVSNTPAGVDKGGDPTFKCEAGMCFLPQIHNTDYPLEFADMSIDWGMQYLNLCAMYGTTPIPNRAAIRFSKRMGFNVIGIAPHYGVWSGRPCDCQIEVLTREMWLGRVASKSGQVEQVKAG